MELLEKKRISEKDFQAVADYICDMYETRKSKRKDFEKHMSEVDRQLRMEPDCTYKMRNGKPDPKKAWFPEMELPYQAQAHELITADCRRLMFPDQGPWFTAHGERTQEYIRKLEADPPFEMTEDEMLDLNTSVGGTKMIADQESVNELVTSWLLFLHNQYDFKSNYDLINSEAIKYGVSPARARMVNKRVFMHSEKGVMSFTSRIPMLVPRSLWDVYLDDRPYMLNNEGEEISPCTIQCKTQSLSDLIKAAKTGQGYRLSALSKLEEKDDKIKVIELEGDIVIPRSRGKNLYVPNMIITVAIGKTREVVRVQKNEFESSSYIPHYYHRESIGSVYGVSPLIKGVPIQAAASDAMNRLLMSGAYDVERAIQYDADDPTFAKSGGPQLYPGASIASTGEVKTIDIGNPATMLTIYSALINQYQELTGTQAPRLGAQTNSHTTAFAKQQEILRGTIRTVDYVRSVNSGPMYKWLELCYKMSLKSMGNKEYAVFSHDKKAYIERLTKDHLPKNVYFEVFGANTPAEDASRVGAEVNALQGALNIEMLIRQMGQTSGLDMVQLQKRLIERGGVQDVAELYVSRGQGASEGTQQQPGLGGDNQFDPGSAGLLLQNLAIRR